MLPKLASMIEWAQFVWMYTQNLLFKVGPIWDAELSGWDAKNLGPVSPGTHINKFVKNYCCSIY